MTLKVDISRDFPELEELTPKGKQKLILWMSTLKDELETVSRRAQEAGALAERLQIEQQMLLRNLGLPPITTDQDAIVGSIGNLSANLLAKETTGAPLANDGYISVKDNLGNTLKLMTTA